MPPADRFGSPTSETGVAILDAAEAVMVEEGFGAVTSRRVAARAGMHASNVHYYFPTIDDLFVALLDRRAERSDARLAGAVADDRPLAAIWRLLSDPQGMPAIDELQGAARRRPKLRARVAEHGRASRQAQVAALRALLPEYGLQEDLLPAELVAAILQGTALLVLRQRGLEGVDDHEVAAKAATALIEHLEAQRAAGRAGGDQPAKG
jgi:AcrR family transcriptional regulator